MFVIGIAYQILLFTHFAGPELVWACCHWSRRPTTTSGLRAESCRRALINRGRRAARAYFDAREEVLCERIQRKQSRRYPTAPTSHARRRESRGGRCSYAVGPGR